MAIVCQSCGSSRPYLYGSRVQNMQRHARIYTGPALGGLSIIDAATIFFAQTYIHNKYMYTIRAYYLQYCVSYAPHRQRRTMDDGHRTMDAGCSTQYYKLTGELKMIACGAIMSTDFAVSLCVISWNYVNRLGSED